MTVLRWWGVVNTATDAAGAQWWNTGETGGTTVLVVPLADGRVVEVAASDSPFVIDEPSEDDDAQPTVDVDGLWVGVWGSDEARLAGQTPVVERECGASLDELAAAISQVLASVRPPVEAVS